MVLRMQMVVMGGIRGGGVGGGEPRLALEIVLVHVDVQFRGGFGLFEGGARGGVGVEGREGVGGGVFGGEGWASRRGGMGGGFVGVLLRGRGLE